MLTDDVTVVIKNTKTLEPLLLLSLSLFRFLQCSVQPAGPEPLYHTRYNVTIEITNEVRSPLRTTGG